MLIAIEGIDGSGKGTQVRILTENLTRYGVSTESISYPRYGETHAAEMISGYLNGVYGSDLHPKLAAMLYAVDRYESREIVSKLLETNDIVIFDRHVGSNLAHQSARMDTNEGRASIIDWIINLEHNVFETPVADLTILLSTDVGTAVSNISMKGSRSYTDKAADLHEGDKRHLEIAQNGYQYLADRFGWKVVNTMRDGNQRTVDEISEELFSVVLSAINTGISE